MDPPQPGDWLGGPTQCCWSCIHVDTQLELWDPSETANIYYCAEFRLWI